MKLLFFMNKEKMVLFSWWCVCWGLERVEMKRFIINFVGVTRKNIFTQKTYTTTTTTKQIHRFSDTNAIRRSFDKIFFLILLFART